MPLYLNLDVGSKRRTFQIKRMFSSPTDLEREIRRHTDLVRNESHWKSELARSKAEAERELANCVNKFQHLGLAFERDTYVWDDDGPSSNGGNSTKLRRDALRYVEYAIGR
jgi:hypothetical protein